MKTKDSGLPVKYGGDLGPRRAEALAREKGPHDKSAPPHPSVPPPFLSSLLSALTRDNVLPQLFMT